MPDRRLALAILTAAMVLYGGAHWAQMEQPAVGPSWILALAGLAMLPAAVSWLGRPRLAWFAVLPASAVTAIGLVTGLWPWRSHHGIYPRAVARVLDDGAHGWFTAHTPFDAGRFASVDRDLKLVFFALAALLAWTLLCRRWALAAVAIGFLLFAMPSTVLDLSAGALRAAIFLGLALAALFLTGEARERSGAVPQAAFLGVAAVLAGLVVGGAPGVSKDAFLGWRAWNPLHRSQPSVNVQYVWNQSYKPLHWPKKKTVVMEVNSPIPLYWKAAVLSDFGDDHWSQGREAIPLANQVGGSYIVPPEFLPPKTVTSDENDTTTITVKIDALADPHLIGTGQALRWDLPSDVRSFMGLDGTVNTTSAPRRGDTYRETAYTPSPSPTDLASAGTGYPNVVAAGITANGTLFRPFGSNEPPAGAPVPELYQRASDQVWRASRADEANTPFGAAFLVEHYLRSAPFKYDQTPKQKKGVPPLVYFMLRSHHGYCQMFSGAMALVLRMHGIPARIAVGFTTGKAPTKTGGPYVVVDRNAHAWVEVFFPGYGWMPFEPTPTRSITEGYSSSSPSFRNITTGVGVKTLDAATKKLLAEAAQVRGGVSPANGKLDPLGKQAGEHGHGGVHAPLALGDGSGRGRFLPWLFTALVIVLIGVLVFKAVAARWRYVRPGPRARAAAAYHDLATFVGDQGMAVRPGYTFEDLAGQVEHTFGVPTTGFARAANRARYAPIGRARAAEAEMRRELRGVKRGVRQRLTRSERAAGAVRLRSVLSAAARRE